MALVPIIAISTPKSKVSCTLAALSIPNPKPIGLSGAYLRISAIFCFKMAVVSYHLLLSLSEPVIPIRLTKYINVYYSYTIFSIRFSELVMATSKVKLSP